MDMRSLIDFVAASVAVHAPFPRSKRPAVDAMATQVTLVMLGIRSGYLPEISISKGILLALLDDLQHRSPHIAILWNETVEQGVFINVDLLRRRIRANEHPQWLSTASPSTLVPVPAFFHKLINNMILTPGTLELIDLDAAIDMIPLVGFLLEYPYAYVASTTDGPFLSGVSLAVYECTVHLCGKWTSVVKFSVPETCEPEDLSSWLMNKFGPRMNPFGIGEPVVTRTTRVMDRVAL